MFFISYAQRFLVGTSIVSTLFFSIVMVPAPVSAVCGDTVNDPYGVDCGEETGLTRQDPRSLASRLINAVLQFTGIILICYIVYAGYLWMMAGGDGEQIEKAKTIISACVIGLIIILSAYSISQFVVSQLRDVTRT